jgi:hypothetical protein
MEQPDRNGELGQGNKAVPQPDVPRHEACRPVAGTGDERRTAVADRFDDLIREVGGEHVGLELQGRVQKPQQPKLIVRFLRPPMALHKIPEDQAFKLLVKTSQETRRKLREIADDVTRTGALPESQS